MARDETSFLGDLDCFPRVEVIPDAAPAPPDYGVVTVETARKYVGTRELPGNRGPLIKAWLAAVDVLVPSSWCTAFAVGCLQEAAQSMGLRSNCPTHFMASGAKLWRWARGHADQCDLIYDDRDLLPGDVVILGHTPEKRDRIRKGGLASGHTYIATTMIQDIATGVHGTVEGNTSPAGSREGDGVYERSRTWFDSRVVGAIRFRAVPLGAG